jgi:hypothetical protein
MKSEVASVTFSATLFTHEDRRSSRDRYRKEIFQRCDVLNNVLAGILLRAGLLQISPSQAGLREIERLSLRAKMAVQSLSELANNLKMM